MFAPIAALANTSILLTGKGTLLSRPIEMVTDGLQKLGVSIAEARTLPVEIEGPLVGGEIHLDGSVSSQFLTGLLLALPYAEKDSKVTVEGITSRPYIDMTLEVLQTFDLDYTHEISEGLDVFHIPSSQAGRGGNFNIDGDWSAAATLLVLGALCAQPELEVTGIRGDFTQADSEH